MGRAEVVQIGRSQITGVSTTVSTYKQSNHTESLCSKCNFWFLVTYLDLLDFKITRSCDLLDFKITRSISILKEKSFCCLKWLLGKNTTVIRYILLDGIIIWGKDWRTNHLARNCRSHNWKEYEHIAWSLLSMSTPCSP